MPNKISIYCDKTIKFCLYTLILCLPFSKAVVEVCVSVAILAWIVKKIAYGNFQNLESRTENSVKEKVLKVAKKLRVPQTELNRPIWAFLFIGAISIVGSNYLYLSLRGFVELLEWVALCFIVVDTVKTRKTLKKISLLFLISIGVVCIDTFGQYFTGIDPIRRHTIIGIRLTGPMGYPNDFAGWLGLVLPLCVGLSLTKYKLKIKSVIVIICAALIFLLIGTYSRGGWLGVVAGLFFLGLLGKKRPLILMLIAILLAVTLIAPLVKERAVSIFALDRNIETERVLIWRGTMEMIEDRPVFGHGLNTFMSVYKWYAPHRTHTSTYAHNCYLQMAADMGIVGLVSFLWIVATLFKTSIRSLRRVSDGFESYLLLGLLGGIVAFLVHSFFDTNFYSLQLIALFWLMVGLTVSTKRICDFA